MYTKIGRKFGNILWILYYWSLIYSIFFYHDSSFAQDIPLRISEPLDSVIADLKSYIPNRMNEADVAGLAIAVIRNNRIVWTDGFGVVNRLTSRHVSSGTVFEAASISKVITAYTALRLVEKGQLSLDEPVHIHLKKPWLPPSTYADRITLRHLLSHSSGLGDDVLFKTKHIMFEPGSDFLYSGMGAEYVKELIEQVTDKSLEEIARKIVFNPIGMSSSSFVNEPSVMTHMANGHMRYLVPLLFFLIPFMLITPIAGIIVLILTRIIKRTWQTSWQLKVGLFTFAFLLTELLLYIFIGKAFPNLIWVTIIGAIVFSALLLLSYMLIRRLMSYISRLRQKKVLQTTITIIWMVISLIVIIQIANSFTGPVPQNHSSEASAIGSIPLRLTSIKTSPGV
jgi:hypothetical protein